MARSFQDDYNKGLEAQKKLLPILRDFFKDDSIEETQDKFCPYDYIGLNKKLELKTRFIKHNQYKTAMLDSNKLSNITEGTKYYIIYNYQDGIYYIEYNKEQFCKYEQKDFQRTGRSDKTDINKKVLYIPYQDLKIINNNCKIS
jgi:hypothetical protein